MPVAPPIPETEAGGPLKVRRPTWGEVPSPTKRREKEPGRVTLHVNDGL